MMTAFDFMAGHPVLTVILALIAGTAFANILKTIIWVTRK
jgi:hypothetical protein